MAMIVTESQLVLSVGAPGDLVNHAGGEAEAVYVPSTGQEMVAESSSPSFLTSFITGILILTDPKVLRTPHYTATLQSPDLCRLLIFFYVLREHNELQALVFIQFIHVDLGTCINYALPHLLTNQVPWHQFW